MNKMAPRGSDSGNTINRVSASKNWCFTFNNYTEDDINNILGSNGSIISELVMQEEIGTNNTKHLQGYLKLKNKGRPTEIFNWTKKIHWEKCRNIKASKNYCSKEDSRNGRQWVYPKKYNIHINDFYEWELNIINLINEKPDDRTLVWIWEEIGCAGKTTFQKWVYCNYKKVVILSGKATDMKNGIIQYEKENKYLPEIILINIPRTSLDYVSYAGIEDIKDMFFYSGKYEGGMVCGPNPHVIIFANKKPEFNNCSLDRWKVVYIGKKTDYEDNVEDDYLDN